MSLESVGDSVESFGDYDVYGIDLANQADKLITIGWFYFNSVTREQVLGGNSRVIV